MVIIIFEVFVLVLVIFLVNWLASEKRCAELEHEINLLHHEEWMNTKLGYGNPKLEIKI